MTEPRESDDEGVTYECHPEGTADEIKALREALKDLAFTSHPDLVPYDEAEHRRALQAANELL